jgi:hypothetical protein
LRIDKFHLINPVLIRQFLASLLEGKHQDLLNCALKIRTTNAENVQKTHTRPHKECRQFAKKTR